ELEPVDGEVGLATFDHRWEFVCVDALDVALVAAAAQVHGLRDGIQREVDAVVGQVVDQIDEYLGGQGDRALDLDVGADPDGDAQPEAEIDGGQFEARLLGLEQDIAQHRHGRARLDGAADDAQPFRQIRL